MRAPMRRTRAASTVTLMGFRIQFSAMGAAGVVRPAARSRRFRILRPARLTNPTARTLRPVRNSARTDHAWRTVAANASFADASLYAPTSINIPLTMAKPAMRLMIATSVAGGFVNASTAVTTAAMP
jgi:hypothetical protein